ncbi:MAG: hypothetical protein ACLSGF_05080 [Alistipes onderdonkii]
MSKVLKDLDFACRNCITNAKLEVNSVRITRNVALAFKARCCLYEGTFRKYHATDPSTGEPWTSDEAEKYLRACVEAVRNADGRGKYSWFPTRRTSLRSTAGSLPARTWLRRR